MADLTLSEAAHILADLLALLEGEGCEVSGVSLVGTSATATVRGDVPRALVRLGIDVPAPYAPDEDTGLWRIEHAGVSVALSGPMPETVPCEHLMGGSWHVDPEPPETCDRDALPGRDYCTEHAP